MRRRLKAVLYAVLVAVGLGVTPVLVSRSLPSEIGQMMNMLGFDLQSTVQTIAIIGLVMAALIFVKTDSEEWAVQHMMASIGLEVLGFYITLYGFGLGDPWSFGLVNLRLPIGNTLLTIDFRVLVEAYALIVVISIVTILLKYRQAEEMHRTGAPAADPGWVQSRRGLWTRVLPPPLPHVASPAQDRGASGAKRPFAWAVLGVVRVPMAPVRGRADRPVSAAMHRGRGTEIGLTR